MPYNPSTGVFTPAITFQDDTEATAEDQNTQDLDLANGLTQAMTRGGLAPATANISMGGFRINNLGAGISSTDAANVGQLNAAAPSWGGTSLGTANAQILASAGFAGNNGNAVSFLAGFTNTGSLTIQPNSTSAVYTVYKNTSQGPQLLTGSEIIAGNFYTAVNSTTLGGLILGAYSQSTLNNYQIDIVTTPATVLNSYAGATLNISTSAIITLTFPTPSTMRPDFMCQVTNTNVYPLNSDIKIISLTGGSTYKLYPGQTVIVYLSDGVWQIAPQSNAGGASFRWSPTSGVNLYVSNSGSDTLNGGLTAATPVASIGKAISILYMDIDCAGINPIVNIANGTYTESVHINRNLLDGTLVFLSGATAGGVIWSPASSLTPYCFEVGLGAAVDYTNINFTKGSIATCEAIYLHRACIVEQGSGVTFGSFVSPHIFHDYGPSTFNINSSYTVNGPASAHISAGPGFVLNQAASTTVTISSAPTIGTWFLGAGAGCNFLVGSTVTFSGAPNTGCQKYNLNGNAVIQLNGNTLPGSTGGVVATGGVAY